MEFIAIDFETATGKRASICEAGICVVRDGEIAETRSWLVPVRGSSVRKGICTVIGTCRFTASVRLILKIPRNSQRCGQRSVNISKTFPCLWRTMPLSTSVAFVTRWNCMAWKNQTSPIIAPFVRHVGFITSAATGWTISVTSSRYLTGGTTGQVMMRRCVHGCS